MVESSGPSTPAPDRLAAEATVRVRAALAGGDGVAAARELVALSTRRLALDDPVGSWLAGVLDLPQAVDAAAALPTSRSVLSLAWLAALSPRAEPDEAVRAAKLAADAAGEAGVFLREDVQGLAPLLPLMWAVNRSAVLRLVGRADRACQPGVGRLADALAVAGAEGVMATGDPLPLLRELAALGMDGHAAALIDRTDRDAAARARAWMALADGALAAGRQPAARAHLASALAVIDELTGTARDEALLRAAESAVEMGDLVGARRVAEGLAAVSMRAAAFLRTARAALSSGSLNAAREDAGRAADDIARTQGLLRDEVVRDIDVADVWCDIAQALHARDRQAEALDAVRGAIAAVHTTGAAVGVWALARVVERAVAVCGPGVVEEAVANHDLPRRHHPVLAVAAVGGLARAGRLGEALGLTRTIATPLARAVALLELVAAAGPASGPIHEHPWLHEALEWLDRDEPDEVIELLDFASPDLEWRARCAGGLARAGLVDRAFAIAEGMPDGTGDREGALIRVGEALVATDRWAEALAAFDAALASAADGNVLRGAQTLARVVQQCATAGYPAEALVRIRAWADDRERAEGLGTLGANLDTPADRRTAFELLSGVRDAGARAFGRARLVQGLLARGDVGAEELAPHLEPQEETVAAFEVARAAARAGDAETFARVAPTVRDGLGAAMTALQVARLLPAQATEVAEEVVGSGWVLVGRRPS